MVQLAMRMPVTLQPASSSTRLTLVLGDVSLDDHIVGTAVLVRQVIREGGKTIERMCTSVLG